MVSIPCDFEMDWQVSPDCTVYVVPLQLAVAVGSTVNIVVDHVVEFALLPCKIKLLEVSRNYLRDTPGCCYRWRGNSIILARTCLGNICIKTSKARI